MTIFVIGTVMFLGGLVCGLVARDMLGHAMAPGLDEQRDRAEKLAEAEAIVAHHRQRVALAQLRQQVNPHSGPVPWQDARRDTEHEPGFIELDDNL